MPHYVNNLDIRRLSYRHSPMPKLRLIYHPPSFDLSDMIFVVGVLLLVESMDMLCMQIYVWWMPHELMMWLRRMPLFGGGYRQADKTT